jgi:hypothetical protein
LFYSKVKILSYSKFKIFQFNPYLFYRKILLIYLLQNISILNLSLFWNVYLNYGWKLLFIVYFKINLNLVVSNTGIQTKEWAELGRLEEEDDDGGAALFYPIIFIFSNKKLPYHILIGGLFIITKSQTKWCRRPKSIWILSHSILSTRGLCLLLPTN